jgi:hypothetical protein
LSEASAVTLVSPETVAPLDGDVMLTDGGVTSEELATVTWTELDSVLFPAASLATAVKVWEPLVALVVSQETE